VIGRSVRAVLTGRSVGCVWTGPTLDLLCERSMDCYIGSLLSDGCCGDSGLEMVDSFLLLFWASRASVAMVLKGRG
jgi:hypothetical protein